MSFISSMVNSGFGRMMGKIDPIDKFVSRGVAGAFAPKPPPTPPGPPNPNDAANAAQAQTDSMRMRRGLMANIYAGGQTGAGSAPVAGKTQLGT